MSDLIITQQPRKDLEPGIYGLLDNLGVDARRVRGKSFWEANEFELDWIYAEFCRAARSRCSELHPDHGGDGYEFGSFRAASQRLKLAFEKRGFGRDMTLHRALEAQQRFEATKAARLGGPVFRAQDIDEIDYGLWHSGVFDRIVSFHGEPARPIKSWTREQDGLERKRAANARWYEQNKALQHARQKEHYRQYSEGIKARVAA